MAGIIYQSDNAASHNAKDLARFDAIVWNNTSGDILTSEQRKAFKAWIEVVVSGWVFMLRGEIPLMPGAGIWRHFWAPSLLVTRCRRGSRTLMC
jgi:hypothetical protein